ncbi:hypothetical protein PAL_GLEAN10009269 [Pteropus alecto]|uniref:Uncharacterized protein n=1 Tax=Pteropus alecto TaxID=9402 RepID=L5KW01_PTEAL|nr:hypothetical protein PAL_GLEAN10009269 [Pteropus alecto]
MRQRAPLESLTQKVAAEWVSGTQADHRGVATSCITASQEDPTATGLVRRISGPKITVTSPSQNCHKHHYQSKTQPLLPAP